MSLNRCSTFWLVGCVALGMCLGISSVAWAQKLPAGFEAELLYSAPEVEHPSVVTCDNQGNLFVGEDPMDMRGPTTKEFDRVLYIQFGPDGKPLRKTVFCDNLAAVFGLVWHEGALYVMHAPHYSVFRDTNGDGVADERKDLATGFGPPAGVYGFNDHIVTGTRMGLDGRIYVSVGDKGIQKAVGSDGSSISLEGGGVVRMWPDGSQLEVFSSGTRNHLDVAMDSLDHIFTYDNTDDGLGWWTRFTYHVNSGYYGYPYDYLQHGERHLPRISEHGGGSPVGAACYTQAAWPKAFQENAFHCEWGKGKIQRFATKPAGASFTAEMEDFMTNDGSGEFRPQDLCFSPDGRFMYVADWNFGGWVNPKVVGRLFRVRYVGKDAPATEPARASEQDPIEKQIVSLGHPAQSERLRAQWNLARRGAASEAALGGVLASKDAVPMAKVHALWTLFAIHKQTLLPHIRVTVEGALNDASPIVRAQAARLLGDLAQADSALALIAKLGDESAEVRMQAAISLGRSAQPVSAAPLAKLLADDDVTVRFVAIQALRKVKGWDAVAQALRSDVPVARQSAFVLLRDQYSEDVVEVLKRAAKELPGEADRATAIETLATIYKKAEPYTTGWWGTRPAAGLPAREKKLAWNGTSAVEDALRQAALPTKDNSSATRLAAIAALQQVKASGALGVLREVAAQDADTKVRVAAIGALAALKDDQATALFAKIAGDPQSDDALRVQAVTGIKQVGSVAARGELIQIIQAKDSSATLVSLALDALSGLPSAEAGEAAASRLTDSRPEVRVAAIRATCKVLGAESADRVLPLLKDGELSVQQAVLEQLASLKSKTAIPQIIEAAANGRLTFDAIAAAAAIPDRRALQLYLQGLKSPSQELRASCEAALVALRDEIGDDIIDLQTRNELPGAVRGVLANVFSTPAPMVDWKMVGPWPKEKAPKLDVSNAPNLKEEFYVGDRKFSWRDVHIDDKDGRLSGLKVWPTDNQNVWVYGYAEVTADAAGLQTLHLGSDDQLIVWINGKQVYEFRDSRGWGAKQGTIQAEFQKGINHIWVMWGNNGGPWDLSVQVSKQSPKYAFLKENIPMMLDLGAYAKYALEHPGDPQAGKKIFFNAQGVGCVKCHAVDKEGGKVGPDLTGIAIKYPREELIRSVLEPSSRIASGYETTTLLTDEGRVISGLLKSETPEALDILLADGKSVRVPVDSIEQRQKSNLSLMPNGLKDGMTLEDFASIVAYLESLKQPPAAGTPASGK